MTTYHIRNSIAARLNLSLLTGLALVVGFASPASAGYVEEVMADNPIGYWRFEETNTNPAADSSGNGRDGTYMPGVISGVSGGAALIGGKSAEFDGTTGFIDLPGSWGGAAMTEMTVEAWVNNSDPITGTFQTILAGHNPNAFAHFSLHSAGNSGVYTPGFVSVPIVPATPTDTWRHVVMTAKSGETKVYLDGVQVGATTTTAFDSITASNNVDIGLGHVNTRWFKGLMDEVAIYDTALSQERVVAHFEAGNTAIPEPSTFVLLGLGLLGLCARGRRRRG